MCEFRILHHSEHGYVVKCAKCLCLQMAFGTMAVSFTNEEFDEFAGTVEAYHHAYVDSGFPDQKIIRIPTACKSVYMAFSLNELVRLKQIMDEAGILIETDKILLGHDE